MKPNCHTCINPSCNVRGGDFGKCDEYIPSEPDDVFAVTDMRVMGIFCAFCGFLIGACFVILLEHFL